MKYLYSRDGFDLAHWVIQSIGNFVHLAERLLRILTLNLVWFDFGLDYTIWSLKATDTLRDWFIKHKIVKRDETQN